MKLLPEIRDSVEAAWFCFKWMAIIALLGVLFGCTTIEKQVDGFPQDLKVTVHQDAGFWAVQAICWEHLPTWRKLIGSICTQVTLVNLDAHTCDIYTISGLPSEHEFEHCTGGDHDGQLQMYYDRWANK